MMAAVPAVPLAYHLNQLKRPPVLPEHEKVAARPSALALTTSVTCFLRLVSHRPPALRDEVAAWFQRRKV
jgi:hypothetical protein